MFEDKVTQDVQVFLMPYVRHAHCSVDLTMGNGQDTVYLAKHSPIPSIVVAMDIQSQALKATRKRLEADGLKATLVLDSHERVADYVAAPIDVAVMNLGYLPGGDKTLLTKTDTTLLAIKATLSLLAPKGVFAITAYTGHAGGQAEYDALLSYFKALPSKSYKVRLIDYLNRGNHPPKVIICQKQC